MTSEDAGPKKQIPNKFNNRNRREIVQEVDLVYPAFSGTFDQILFAVFDRMKDLGVYRSFREILGNHEPLAGRLDVGRLVGDSILSHKAHLSAGVILSNVRLDRQTVTISTGDALIPTGLRKFGAIIGDHTEIGCNSVIGHSCILYPGSQWRGVLDSNKIVRVTLQQSVVERN